MRKIAPIFVACALTALALPANAQFTVSGTSLNSAGSIGNPQNDTFWGAATPNVTSKPYGSLRIQGHLSSLNSNTWVSDATINMSYYYGGNPSDVYANVIADGTNSTFGSNYAIDRTMDTLAWVGNWQTRIETWENFDNAPGPDAVWDDLSVSMSGTPDLTMIDMTHGNGYIDTFGSDFDTSIAVYNLGGTLLATNDNAGGTHQSQVYLPDIYSPDQSHVYIVVGSADAQFNNRFAVAGADPTGLEGNYQVNFAGVAADSGYLNHDRFKVYYALVPEPGTFLLLGFGALAAFRRQKRTS